MELLKIIPEKESLNLVEDMRLELDLFVLTAAKFGIPVQAYTDPSLPLFKVIPAPIQKQLLQAARVYRVLCEEFFRDEIFVERDQIELLAHKAKIKISDDYLNNIQDGDVVEIYDKHSAQLFRTVNFFRVCSYSLEELYSIPWFELYRRDEFFQKQTHTVLQKVMNREISGCQPLPVMEHHVYELRSSRMYKILIQPRNIGWIKDFTGAFVGYAHSFRSLSCESQNH